MTRKLDRTQIAEVARIVAPAPAAPTVVDHPPRSFELPTRLYALTVGAYLAFLGVTATAFASGGLLIPIAICAIYIVMAFGVSGLWTRMRPDSGDHALTWAQFRNRGIVTGTGHCDAGSATLQVLILPALILVWGLATTVLYAVLT